MVVERMRERKRERDNGLTTNTYRAYRYAQKQYHIVVVSNHYQLALVVVHRSIAGRDTYPDDTADTAFEF